MSEAAAAMAELMAMVAMAVIVAAIMAEEDTMEATVDGAGADGVLGLALV